MPWLALGGIILLAGGAVYALRRRRPAPDDRTMDADLSPAHAAPVMEPATSVAMATSPVHRELDQPLTAAPIVGGSAEALAAQAPSKENPFLTRKNRLRRARYLMRQQAGETQGAVPAAEETRSAQVNRGVTYDFSRAGQPLPRSGNPKPLWT